MTDDESRASAVPGFEQLFIPGKAEYQKMPPVLIENTLYKGGIMLIGAPPKTRKTFLVAQLVVSLATGTSILGFAVAECERILVVNTEMGAAEFTNRIVSACPSPAVAERVASRYRLASTDELPELTIADVAGIIVGAAGEYKPDVVIVDPIYPLFIGDENSNDDARRTLAQLKMIGAKTGASVIYTHHFSKGAQDFKAARDRVSGAGTLSRNYAAMWSLTELEPSEDDRADYPDGTMFARVSTDLRSFPRTSARRNLDFVAAATEAGWLRVESGSPIEAAPTVEAARRAASSSEASDKRKSRAVAKIRELLEENKGEPVDLTACIASVGTTDKTLKGYVRATKGLQLVKLKVGGKGQRKTHVACASWQAPPEAEPEGAVGA